jgi:hypothetical protein
MEDYSDDDFDFFITSMPASRPAHFYLAYYGGSVYLDFDKCADECVCLKRISFDGYGCCHLKEGVVSMNKTDSLVFKEMMSIGISDQGKLMDIVKQTIADNKDLLWKEALEEYHLL